MLTLFTARDSLYRKEIASTFYYRFINTSFSSSALFLLEFIVNMALRATENSSMQTSSLSHLVGLPVSWNDADENPTMEWDKWVDLFQVAVMAKYSISITELTGQVTEQNPRVRALTGNLDEDPASKKIVSVLYLSLGGGNFGARYVHLAHEQQKITRKTLYRAQRTGTSP